MKRASKHPAPARFFSSSSVWNRPVARKARLSRSSRARVGWLLRYLKEPGHGPWINTYQYSVPIYQVSAHQPTVKVKLDAWNPSLQNAWQAVPLPPTAAPSEGTDASLVVYQPSKGKMWEFWQLSRGAGGAYARWGGAMEHVSRDPGYYSPRAWASLTGNEGYNWGAGAASLPAVAGLMTIAELRAGYINHALAVATPQACASWFVFPAQRTDGTSTDRDCLPEGAHLRLDPRLDLAKRHLPRIALIIARAMQRYGIIVHDTTNASMSLYAQDPTGGRDPYDGPGGLFDGLEQGQFLNRIPWNHLQLLAGRACTTTPCRALKSAKRPHPGPVYARG